MTKDRQNRTLEKDLSYAVGHRIRIEILGLLNETPRSPKELARMLGYPLNLISYHIKELRKSKSIELAETQPRGNTNAHIYRAVDIPFVSDEEARELPPEIKQEFAAVILRAIMAEALASLWAGKMSCDDDIWMSWRWFHLDDVARREVADEQAESWKRVVEIESRCAARVSESGQPTTSTIVAALGFERFRPVSKAASLPDSTGIPIKES